MTQLEESFGAELELRARAGAITLVDPSTARVRATRRNRVSAIATGFALLLAGLLAWKMWDAYMLGPWTRDATVRAYVIAEVPEVSGQITRLAVHADQYVHKGNLLLEIDPIDYGIAVSQSEATVRQAQANVQNIDAQMTVQYAQINASQAQLQQGKPRSYLRNSRPNATKPSRSRAGVPFKMPSSLRRRCISRKRRCSQRKKTSTRRCGKSNRGKRSA